MPQPPRQLVDELERQSFVLDRLIYDMRLGTRDPRYHDVVVDRVEEICAALRGAARGRGPVNPPMAIVGPGAWF